MYSFDGDFKPKRSINLGGNSSNQSKQSLLEQAREQRRLRNEQRIQNEAAQKIQNVSKLHLFKTRVQHEQFEIFNRFGGAPNNLEEYQIYLKSFLLSLPNPNWFLKNPTSANSNYYNLLISHLPQVIQISSQISQNSQISILEPFNTTNSSSWGVTVNRLVQYILLQSNIPKDQFLFLIKLLKGMAGSDYQIELFNTCLKFNVFGFIKNEIEKQEDTTYLLEFLTLPLDFNYTNDFKFSYFTHLFTSILTLEGTSQSLNTILNSLKLKLIQSCSTEVFAEAFINSIKLGYLSDIDKVLLVYNYFNLIEIENNQALLNNTELSIKLFNSIILNLGFEQNFITSQNEYELLKYELTLEDEKDSDVEDDDEFATNGKLKPAKAKEPVPKKIFVNEAILNQIKLILTSTNILRSLISNIDKSNDYLLQFSEYIVTLLFKWPSMSRELISNLLYNINFSNVNLIKRLYEYWTSLNLHEICTEKSIYSELFKSSAFTQSWIALTLLSECLSQHMVAIGDEESLTDLLNLKLHNLINITVALRNITFYLYWNEAQIDLKTPLAGTELNWYWIRSKLTKLAGQLYDRDSRANFTGEGFWVARWNCDLASVFYVNVARELHHDSQNLDEDEITAEVKKSSSMLNLLKNIPFTLPFTERVKIFSKIIEFDKSSIPPQLFDFNHVSQVASVRRGRALEDGFLKLNHLGAQMKGLIKIEFISELGYPEAGIDGGGVFKEFLNSVIKQAFDTNYGLFLHTPQRYLYPNPHTYSSEEGQLQYYEFLGRIVGKALYEGILVNAPLARFFVAKWLGEQSYFNDLPSLDLELYRGLKVLKSYKGDVEADFGLNFTLSNQDFGETTTVELIPNGSNIPVTKQNRIKYTYLVADYRLNRQIRRQSSAFLKGLNDLIHPNWLKLFHATELQLLVGGQTQPIDLDDFKTNTTYSGVYDEYHPVILAFWDVVEEFDQEERAKLLEFITSCPRPPMLGFSQLNPPLCIRSSEQDDNRLPTASTCVNLLKLPVFTSREVLKNKLVYAINAGAGFEFS